MRGSREQYRILTEAIRRALALAEKIEARAPIEPPGATKAGVRIAADCIISELIANIGPSFDAARFRHEAGLEP
jgi:hypothetical protein